MQGFLNSLDPLLTSTSNEDNRIFKSENEYFVSLIN